MSWYDFDSFGSEPRDFSTDARELVLKVFTLTLDKLDEQFKRTNELMEARIKAAKDDYESMPLYEEMGWEQVLQRQRQQGAGALALDWLMHSLKSTLNRAKHHFNKTHPAKCRYQGDGWMARMRAEYLDRFGIDLEKGPNFTRIEELVLGRNAGIHRDENTMKEYLSKVKNPRFIDADYDDVQHFCVSRQALFSIIEESELYAEWVVSELKRVRSLKPSSRR